jgi:hypothetical protein
MMLRTCVLRAVLGVGVLTGVLGLVPSDVPDPFVGRAEAGPRSTARRVLRHREHTLQRREHFQKRQVHREQRQVSHIKRELHTLRQPLRVIRR